MKSFWKNIGFTALLVVLTSGLSLNTYAQVIANFTIDDKDTVGCVDPTHIVKFTDASEGNPTSWLWDFGNNTTSTEQNPIPQSFTEVGTYTVSLTVGDGTTENTITKTALIQVLPNPKAAFTFTPDVLCEAGIFDFTDSTDPNGTIIASWEWDFGDGISSDEQSPSHEYSGPGTRNVSLIVTSTAGCKSLATNSIVISPNPVINAITATPSGGCITPQIVEYSADITGINNYTYNWTFLNGTPSESTNPTPTINYTELGSYGATLQIVDSNGCEASFTNQKAVVLDEVTANFTTSNITCVGTKIDFTNTSSASATNFQWTFNGGANNNQKNPSFIFLEEGEFPVQLIAASDGCSDTATQLIEVVKIDGTYILEDTFSCNVPSTFSLTGNVSGPVSEVNYVVRDANGKTVATSSGISSVFELINPGEFTVTMYYGNDFGCLDSFVNEQKIIITSPIANATVGPLKGCAPLLVDFTNTSTIPDGDELDQITWSFSDGSPNVTDEAFEFEFTNAEVYTVTQTIKTKEGCESMKVHTITAAERPIAAFSLPAPEMCATEKLQLEYEIDETCDYMWDFGDGQMSSEIEPKHVYRDTGFFDVTLILSKDNCPDTLKLDSAIYVKGSISLFEIERDCDNPSTISFTNNAKDYDVLEWDYGNGVSSSELNPTYNYPEEGEYTVRLITINTPNGCGDTVESTINIAPLELIVNTLSEDSICIASAEVLFDASASKNVSNYNWNFGDGTTGRTASVLHTYKTLGSFEISLFVSDEFGCQDSAFLDISIFGPSPSITALNPLDCTPLSTGFENNTEDKDAIATWNWTIAGQDNSNDEVRPDITFDIPGRYQVVLEATDTTNCTNSTTITVEAVKDPEPRITFKDQVCAETNVPLNNQTLGTDLSFNWTLSNGITTTDRSPVLIFEERGSIDFIVKATDTLGCNATLRDSFFVQKASSAFSASPRSNDCEPFSSKFSIGDSTDLVKYEWHFGEDNDGFADATFNSPVQPANTYEVPGLYTIQLTTSTSLGCTSTTILEDYIELTGVFASLSATKDSICLGDTITFFVNDQIGDFNARLKLGDNTAERIIPTDDGGYNYVYQKPNSDQELYRPVLVLEDDGPNECTRTIESDLLIFVDSVSVSINPIETAGCPPFVADLQSTTSDNVNKWLWTFEDESTFSGENVGNRNYEEEGTYTVFLEVIGGPLACSNEASIDLTIHPLPVIGTIEEVQVCEGKSGQMSVDIITPSNPIVSWEPTDFLDNPNSPVVTVTPFTSVTYTVTVKNSFDCTTSTTVQASLVPELDLFSDLRDTTIIIGDSALLRASFDEAQVAGFTWEPSDHLNCAGCTNTFARPFEDREYTFTATDTSGCFTKAFTVQIFVEDDVKVEMPQAFTPNGDGINDQLFVNGWGIDRLISFTVFNRWGEEIWSTTSLEEGWDGTRNGKPQNMDTYVYVIQVEYVDGTIPEPTIGEIALIK